MNQQQQPQQPNFALEILNRSIHGRSTNNKKCSFDSTVCSILNKKPELLSRPVLSSPHVGSITSLDVDNNNNNTSCGRYMLSSSWDGTISLFDLEQRIKNNNNSNNNKVVSVLHKSIRCSTTATALPPRGHSAAITCVQWYTFDNGMFLSSSMDGSVLLWDTNTFQTAHAFYPFRNHATTDPVNNSITYMSLPRSTSSAHSLIATASSFGTTTTSNSIVLCDVNSGAAVHTLQGHGSSINCVAWSPSTSFELCSGSNDGTVRLWDIRKSGSHACVCILDYYYCNNNNNNNKNHTNTNIPVAPNAYAHLQSCHVSSHEDLSTSITNVAYSPNGQYLTTIGTDNKLLVWKGNSTSDTMTTTSMQPLPIYFLGEDFMKGPTTTTTNRKQSYGSTPLLVTSFDNTNDSSSFYIYIGNRNGSIFRHRLITTLQEDNGGRPELVLKGHLTDVTSIAAQNVGGQQRLWSGSADGMILGWGYNNDERRQTQTQKRHYYYHRYGSSSSNRSNSAAVGKQKSRQQQKLMNNEIDEDNDCWSDD